MAGPRNSVGMRLAVALIVIAAAIGLVLSVAPLIDDRLPQPIRGSAR